MFAKSSEKMLLVVSVLTIVLFDCCYSSTFITPPITHPAYPGKCFEPVTMQVIKPIQDVYLPNGCMKLTCLRDLRFGGVGCASEEAIGKNCRQVAGDRKAMYPDCCPRWECDDDHDDSYNIFEYGSNSL